MELHEYINCFSFETAWALANPLRQVAYVGLTVGLAIVLLNSLSNERKRVVLCKQASQPASQLGRLILKREREREGS